MQHPILSSMYSLYFVIYIFLKRTVSCDYIVITVYQLHEDCKEILIPLKSRNLEFLFSLPGFLACCVYNPEVYCCKLISEAAGT